jgi:dolichyl-diphosphooligosaccharide--protein glycosyltransferase
VSNFWLTTVAGRFLNDLIPQIVIFASMVVITLVDKINYKQMIKNINNTVGLGKLKRIRYTHYLGVLFVALLVIFPNVFTSLDAAIPPEDKAKYFGANYTGYFGNSLGEQYYWADAFHWLSQQDNEIAKPQDRPAFLSWWDYGFYGVSMGEHPVVADNYQDGFYPASNFLTSQSEMEAVVVLIIRLAEGTQKHLPPDGRQIPISSAVEQVFRKHFPPYNETINTTSEHIKIPFKKVVWHYPAEDIIRYMNNKTSSPSYNTLISEEWGNKVYRKNADNAMYQDVSKIIATLNEDNILALYKDMVTATGYDIRYFGIERRDITDIFAVFTFLSDKSVFGYATTEDDWYQLVFTDDKGNQYPFADVQNMTQDEYQKLNLKQNTVNKEIVSQAMAYRLFYGIKTTNSQFLPTYTMRHFYPIFIWSDYNL